MSIAEPSPPRPSHSQAMAKAGAATAATVLVIAGVCIFFFCRLHIARKRLKHRFRSSFRREVVPVMLNQELRQQGEMLHGRVVEERGLDVVCVRDGQFPTCFSKVWNNPMGSNEDKIRNKGFDFGKAFMCDLIPDIPLLQEPGKATNYAKDGKQMQQSDASEHSNSAKEAALANQPSRTPISPLPSLNPSEKDRSPHPPPPPPLPPPPPTNRVPIPPPTPVQAKTKPPPPAIIPKAGKAFSRSKPPIPSRQIANSSSRQDALAEENAEDNGENRVKLKPLYWEKVTANVDHSMVWDKINDGSFRFEDNLMETLFGYSSTSKESTEGKKNSSGSSNPDSNAQIFILDPRKSQNTAIVIKSLAISRREILDALVEGRGLNAEILEKLTKIAPTQEEAASILQFDGDATKLADAESFLYYILKAVPSAFIRLNAMLFRSNYDPEMLHFQESVQALELACRELRTPGIFLRLLEAILKAGNRMNAGTPRGNAQGFDLSTLRKLSTVKSTDGKTTLLHFVVEQVARFEGKRCAMNQELMISTSENAGNKEDDRDLDSKTTKEEREKEYLMLGLPLVRCLSTELSNLKKAAAVDYDSFINTCSSLTIRVNDIRQLLTQCGNRERGHFFRVMTSFLEECNEELKVVREEKIRVMEMVKNTAEYYQAGGSKDKSSNTHPLQLFLILKDFLDMVDQACIDITRKVHRTSLSNGGWSPPPSPTPGTPVRFQNMNLYFMQENGGNFSTDSEDDF